MDDVGKRPHLVILGGGFGGLYAARSLRRAPLDITIVDKRNHHLFQPLLYEVATAGLNPSDIAAPIRRIFRKQKNAAIILAEATAIDAERKTVVLADGEISYDYLIVATGATHSYFGHDEWAPYAPGLKTLEDALEIRRRVLLAYEAAEREGENHRRSVLLTFVIVGGGPTGVELAGALSDISRHALARDFRNIDPTQARILLVEGLDRILPTFPPELSKKALQKLEKMGVTIRTGSQVTRVSADCLWLGDERIYAGTVLWAAGVAASPIAKSLGVPLDPAGRVRVEPDLAIPGHKEIFVVGDLAYFEQDGRPVPGVAQAAIQQGRSAAQSIVGGLSGRPYRLFRYRDKGMLAAIGRSYSVANLRHLKLSGFIAWAVWAFVHISFLIGFRNRLVVMIEWSWRYFTWDRGARLITGSNPVLVEPRHTDWSGK